MKAAKCKICGEEHWGPICLRFQSASQRGEAAKRRVVELSKPDPPARKKREAVPKPTEARPRRPKRKSKRLGRPPGTGKVGRPWEKAGLSRATWYRRAMAVRIAGTS